jgi:hypothetical protein
MKKLLWGELSPSLTGHAKREWVRIGDCLDLASQPPLTWQVWERGILLFPLGKIEWPNEWLGNSCCSPKEPWAFGLALPLFTPHGQWRTFLSRCAFSIKCENQNFPVKLLPAQIALNLRVPRGVSGEEEFPFPETVAAFQMTGQGATAELPLQKSLLSLWACPSPLPPSPDWRQSICWNFGHVDFPR